MSLNDYVRLSNNDLELYKQLSDSSYRSINGKRQSSRNFKDGVLNLGQIHFEQPKDVLTKEMILEYQKEQQGKPAYTDITSGDQFNYVPSNITEKLNVFNPTNLPSGAPATENDIGQKKNDLNVVLSNLKILSNNENVTNKLINDLKLEETELTNNEKKISDILNEFNKLEAQTKNKIRNLDSNITSKTSKLSSLVQQAAINKLTKEIEALEQEKKIQENLLKELQSEITKTQPKVTALQTKIVDKNKLIKDAERDLRNIKRNKGLEEAKIPNLETELKQFSENYEQNKIDAAEIKRQNKLITKKYEDAFNLANLNRINIQQDQNETEEDFIQRLQTLEGEKFDVNIYKDKAQGEQNKRLSENLKNVIRNDYIIWDVIKALTSEQIFETNKFFNIISTRLLKLFGYDNKNISPKDLRDEIIKTLDIIKTEPENVYELEDADKPGISVSGPTIDGDFEYDQVDNSLYIKNINTKKHYYIKIGLKDGKKLIFTSDTNDQGSFKNLSFIEKGGFKQLLKDLELNNPKNKTKLDDFFGEDLKRDKIYDYLNLPSTGLNPINPSSINKITTFGKILYGYGLNKIPETTQFGKNIILLKKLYYNNILSIKDRNLHNIEGLKNVPVSDNFVKIIMDIVTKQKPSLHNINKLKSNEKELYNILLLISGVHKNIKINDNEKTQQINNLKNRLDIAEGEIKAGNDNPVILSELQEIIYKLYHLNIVSLYNARNYLKQFKLSLK